MLRNIIKTALRSALKNRKFTVINVTGLALGVAVCLVIVLYVYDELNFDNFNYKSERIYRIETDMKFGGNEASSAASPAPLASAIKTDFPEIEEVARLRNRIGFRVKKGSQYIQETKMAYADPEIFNVFTLPMIVGNTSQALKEPFTVVITESTAKKYFNSLDVIGQNFTFDDTALYKITGIIRDFPRESHFNFDFLISMSSLEESKSDFWFDSNFHTYVVLKPGSDYKKLSKKFPAFLERRAGPQLEGILHMDLKQFEQAGNYLRLELMPLKAIHLNSNKINELSINGDERIVYIFASIAIFILLIACVNFMNLSTARLSDRTKEIGVRKVLGSSRKYLIIQFLTESIITALISTLSAFVLVLLLLPAFNQIVGEKLSIKTQIVEWLFPILVTITIIVGCIAGSYPAMFLSSFNPIAILKGRFSKGFKGATFRGPLVVFQFAVSVALIIGTLVIYTQLKYIQNKDLGYNRNQVVVIHNTYALAGNAEVFRQAINQLTGVVNASFSEAVPTSNPRTAKTFFNGPTLDEKQMITVPEWGIDEEFIPTMSMTMVAGRNFSKVMRTDSSALIVNESAAKLLNYPNPLNKMLYQPQDAQGKLLKPYHIVGVIKDFNFRSLKENVTPLIFNYDFNPEELSVRIKNENISTLLSQIKGKWRSIVPGQQFDYSFMDEDFDKLYSSEQRIGKIAICFATLAIIIAGIGLFGLSIYAAEQRAKEIAIRKVLGASVSTILSILSAQFVKYVVIAIVIAIPLSMWYMQRVFLQGFAYREQIPWWVVVCSAFGAIMIALFAVAFQFIKAVRSNPVVSLKSE